MACGMAFNGLLVALLVTLLTASVPATLAAPSAAESMPTQEDRLLAASSATRANTGPHYRLPVTAIPLDYKVALTVDNTDTFTGDVSINTVAVRAASFFKLHVNPTYIKIKSASVVTENKFPEVTWAVDEELQIVTFTWPSSASTILVPGTKYRIDITFDGTLRTDMYGFYRSTFKTVTNNVETEIRLAATQFEPTHARSAFPCWDEPNYKATFDLSITHTATQYSMANTPGTRATLTGDRVTTTFQKTPRMTTYLVAFVVTDVQFEQPSTTTPAASATQSPTSALPYGVYVRPDHRDEAKYAADVGPKSLSWLSDFTGIPYSTMGLNKLDLIAIPDFSAGAMENWGLITFRETGLMFLEGESTESSRESIALVIAHEQAHMWFGDLVSPEWWGYLWLNEGFARYMQYVAMDKVQPQWKLMETYVVKSLQGALAYDALASTHPMSATVHAPNEISGIFDMISYDKGAAILHMTRNTIGEENFKTAIRSYLTEMMYFSAAPQDLFRAFDTVAAQSVFPLPTGVTMATVLKTWTEEAGYPVVTIQTTADGSLSVNQSLFSSTESAKTADTRWWVPLTYVVDGGAFSNPSKMWLDPSKDIVSINEGNKAWVIANIDQTGFYRVNYDEANWQALGALLQSDGGVDKVPQLNRAQLLDDALSLAQAGLLRYNIALDFTRYLHLEKHPSPWTAVLTHLAFLYNMLAENSAQESLKTYILEKLDPVYKVVGFAETETDTDANHQVLVFRATLLGRACKLGHPGCVSDATAAFRSFVDSGNTPKPSQRSTVYCTGLRNAATATAASDWNFLWKRYSATTTSPGERTLILGALGCTSDAEKLRTYLGYSLDSTMVRSQDAQAVFSAVLAGNRENVEVAFQFFKDNLQKMSTQYGGWSSMQRVVQGLASNIYDEDKLKELEEVLTANSAILGSTEAGASRSLETARSNLQWRARHLADVSAWVTGTYSAAAPSAASPLLLAVTLVAMLTRLSA